MRRRVYFAFNYEDVKDFRVNVVRHSGVVDKEDSFIDASLWEKTKKNSDLAIKRMIDKGLERTSVTVVLIGTNTYDRRWVRYEIAKSLERGNTIFGIYIHGIRDKFKRTGVRGKNPFEYMGFEAMHNKLTLYEKDRFLDFFWLKCKHIPPLSLDKLPYNIGVKSTGRLSVMFPVYDWVLQDGFNNFNTWIRKSESNSIKANVKR